MKKILIIGNGESVLQAPLGAAIDEFGIIGRINNYATKGFEEFVGSRTHIWFNGANQRLQRRSQLPERIIVLIPPAILKEKGSSIHVRITRRLHTDRSRYELVPLEQMESLAVQCGVRRPTTGTAAILWALDNFDEVIIHGFDFFMESKGHYNDGKSTGWLIRKGLLKKAQKHDMQQEKDYIEDGIAAGRIKKLTNLVTGSER